MENDLQQLQGELMQLRQKLDAAEQTTSTLKTFTWLLAVLLVVALAIALTQPSESDEYEHQFTETMHADVQKAVKQQVDAWLENHSVGQIAAQLDSHRSEVEQLSQAFRSNLQSKQTQAEQALGLYNEKLQRKRQQTLESVDELLQIKQYATDANRKIIDVEQEALVALQRINDLNSTSDHVSTMSVPQPSQSVPITLSDNWQTGELMAMVSRDSQGVVRLTGRVNEASPLPYLGSLPIGYRPAQEMTFPVYCEPSAVYSNKGCYAVIKPDGEVNLYAKGSASLDGISFKAKS